MKCAATDNQSGFLLTDNHGVTASAVTPYYFHREEIFMAKVYLGRNGNLDYLAIKGSPGFPGMLGEKCMGIWNGGIAKFDIN